jgi:hypothetical protein
MTHLPGLAVLLLSVASAVRSRWVVAGALVGLLLLTKLILTPVAVGALAVIALHRRRSGGLWALVRAAAAAVTTVAAGVAALWARGELPGWLDNFRLNADYADGELAQSQYGSIVGHLLRAFPEDGRGGGAVSIVVVGLVLLVIRRSWTPGVAGSSDPPAVAGGTTTVAPLRTISPAVLWDLALVTLTLALVVIAATATWPHHAQTLSVPGACVLALLTTRLSPVATWRTVAVLLAAGYIAAGVLHPYFLLTSARGVPTSLRMLQQESPASASLASQPQLRTYARAGSNDTAAHALGLRSPELACPRFHQYSIEPAAILDATATCLPRADALIIDDSLRPEAGASAWNAYVARVRALVATGYDCSPTAGAEACVRRVG